MTVVQIAAAVVAAVAVAALLVAAILLTGYFHGYEHGWHDGYNSRSGAGKKPAGLRPCPQCCSTDIQIYVDTITLDRWWCGCRSCRRLGPSAETKEAAILAWERGEEKQTEGWQK